MSWGPLIHGHAPRGLVKALAAAARRGTSFGAPSPLEVDAGRTRPAADAVDRAGALRQLRHRSGDERGPRGARGHRARRRSSSSKGATTATPTRSSCKAGSGALTLGVPTSPGVTAGGRRPTRCSPATTTSASVRAALRRQPRADRRAHRRADRRQHGRSCRRPTAFCAGLRDVCTRARRAADLRRGDFRIPRGAAAARRQLCGRQARPDLPRQDHRRRPAGRRLRRPRRPDGARLAGRARSIRPARSRAIRSR